MAYEYIADHVLPTPGDLKDTSRDQLDRNVSRLQQIRQEMAERALRSEIQAEEATRG